ncbi:pyocin knob domain-containing protein [Lacrimispora sp.]|uniref:pyocin knob domain-containing protein n=1 Tax=Lacrimispora sp. TaxID=2719234 RepID=UPI0028AA5022|nr:hypothetical protein [Lacrimispora sp.]
MEISKFYEKLNKIEGNIYVIEEKAELIGGVYDAQLQHDNINTSTLSVYTGPKLTGERIQTYVLSTPSLTPWKRTIRIYSDVPVAYISYEAEGDTVEAEDVNQLQEEVVRTQEAVNEEVSRAQEAEQKIIGDLGKEVARAKTAEQTVSGSLTAEIKRSTGAEQELSWGLTAEINRAKEAERSNADNLVTETTRALAAEESIRSTIQSNKSNWDDKYTRNEVDNKFATLENDIDWKETVNTYADIAVAYPNPQDGWTVNVKDTDYTYRYNGTAWVVISANAIPKATQSVDGLLSKEDKTLYDDANSKKHTHGNKPTIDKVTETLIGQWNEAYVKRHEHENKGILDTIAQTMLDNWNAAFMHVSDAVKHITAAERTNWNDADSKKHSHSNKTILDGITSTLIVNWNAAYTHISDAVKHVTAVERAAWNTVSDKVDTVPGKGLSTNDYTSAEKNKLAGIATGAEVNVQADFNVTDTASDAYIKNKPTSMPASDVSAWAKASTKPGYAWSEISGKPTSFSPATHTHTKSQITDMSTKVSEFENDTGYITAADIDTSQNHTHANKSVLDTITQTLLNNWNAAYTHISNKSNPHGVTAAQVGALESLQLSNSDNLDEIKIPGFYFAGGGNAVTGKPSGTDAFGLQVYKTASGYVTQDLIAGTGNPYKRYTRQWSNSVWSDWIPLPTFTSAPVSGQVVISDGVTGGIKSSGFTIAKSVPSNAAFTDTVYTHPNSGVTAGTYRSVTVNTQGHVTSGTNPTTLAGYGITDAATKTHNHDSAYLKKTGLTWDDLKGVL